MNQDKIDFCFIPEPASFPIRFHRRCATVCQVLPRGNSVHTILPDDLQRGASDTASGPMIIVGALSMTAPFNKHAGRWPAARPFLRRR
ncbi:MAG: hypothetical protein LBC18_09235 [Opitutaceae bacterium]|nr:hypothetical protein [Opitutaceae bacterium]